MLHVLSLREEVSWAKCPRATHSTGVTFQRTQRAFSKLSSSYRGVTKGNKSKDHNWQIAIHPCPEGRGFTEYLDKFSGSQTQREHYNERRY